MNRTLIGLVALLLASSIHGQSEDSSLGLSTIQPPPAVVTKNVPAVSVDLARRIARYQNVRTASVADWVGDALLIGTRFGDTTQLHLVRGPLSMREQITFGNEPIGGAIVPHALQPNVMVYSKDTGGSEAYQLYLMDLLSREVTLLTDGKSRYSGISFSPSGSRLSYTSTELTGRDTDLFIHDLDGERQVVQQGQGVGWSIADWAPDESRILITRYISAVESQLFQMDLSSKSRVRLLKNYESISLGSVAYSADGNTVYFVSYLDSNYRRVFALDLETHEVSALSPQIEWDVSFFRLSNDGSTVAIVINEAGYSSLYLMNLETNEEIETPSLAKGILSGLSFSFDDSKLAFSMQSTTQQSDVFVMHFDAMELEQWTASELGELSVEGFGGEELLTYSTFDHREIPVFVMRPNADGPHPSLIYIHGGPESQYRPRFSSTFHFYLQELGVALWVPNVRGSAGYGKEYLGLDNGMLRENSVRDIGSLIKFIHQQPDMDPERIGVIGGSYGGYMVLASLVKYGDLIKAGVETVGISNFVTFLENTQDYRRDLRRVEYGDERDPEMRAFLESIAPINHVEKITSPLLIGQGLNDPRVPASESEQIFEALASQDVSAWYMLAKDEGHGFRKKPNRDYWQYVVSMFLEEHLVQ